MKYDYDCMLHVVSQTAGTLPGPLYKEEIKLSKETEKTMSELSSSQSTSKFIYWFMIIWSMWFVYVYRKGDEYCCETFVWT